jgi:hypothetical protein
MPRLWPFPVRQPVTEVLEWNTDTLITEAAEQRIALRTLPRSILTVSHRLNASDLAPIRRAAAWLTEFSYTIVGDLEAAIYDYLGQHNAKPKPFTWTKTAEDILARERRALDKLDEIRGNR